MAKRRLFIPFNELMPDSREFNNQGMTQALGVAPIGDTYVPTGTWQAQTAALPSSSNISPRGLHAHASPVSTGWYGYFAAKGSLYEANTTTVPWPITDKSRVAGGAYTTNIDWGLTSYGDSVIMTNYVDDPQLLTSPAAANFQKLAQSGGANPGMDPKARYVFPVRDNVFLANLFLASSFDGLAAGANPNVVAWSQTDNARQYGSFNVTPQLTGTGYQPLLYDLGAITGAVGGQYGLIALQRGWVRVDGPPYTFRPISEGIGCQCSNSIVRFDNDVYFWGPNGPMCFVGGEGPAIPIAQNKLTRTLTDAVFGGQYCAGFPSGANPDFLSANADHVNRLVWWSIGGPSINGGLTLIYAVDSEQFSFTTPVSEGDGRPLMGISFLRLVPEQLAAAWVPGRDLVGILSVGQPGPVQFYLATAKSSAFPVLCVLEKGYTQLDPELTTRILRVRPVYSLISPTTVTTQIDVLSKSRPFDVAAPQSYTGMDTHGWITTPSTLFADFHRVKLTLSAIPGLVAEIAGIEVEFMVGGVYSA